MTDLVGQLRTNLSRYELSYIHKVQDRSQADRQHEEILDALISGEPDHAANLITGHWHDGMHSILEWLDGHERT